MIDEDCDEAVPTSNITFSSFDPPKTLSKKAKRDVFHGRDYKRLLMKAEKRQERLDNIRERDAEKASVVQDHIKWQRAIKRAAGEKVHDNVELLKKSLKRKEKKNERSKQKWSERLKQQKQRQRKQQERRKTNIQKRRNDKVKKKIKRRLVKGT